jgi:hypothetical protein
MLLDFPDFPDFPHFRTFVKGSFANVKAALQWEILIMRNTRNKKNDPSAFRRK